MQIAAYLYNIDGEYAVRPNSPDKGAIVFVDPSHQKYQCVNRALADLGVPVTWVRDTEAALFLVQTSRVALVVCDAATINAAWRHFLAEVSRISPSTERLVVPVSSDPADRLFELIDWDAFVVPTANEVNQARPVCP